MRVEAHAPWVRVSTLSSILADVKTARLPSSWFLYSKPLITTMEAVLTGGVASDFAALLAHKVKKLPWSVTVAVKKTAKLVDKTGTVSPQNARGHESLKNGGFRGFHLRLDRKRSGEFCLICAVHNLKEIVGAILKGEVRLEVGKMAAAGA
jgi:hypothetical protein